MYILPCILFSVFLNDFRFNSITSLNVKYICRWIGTIRNALNQILANLFKNHFPPKHNHAKYETFTVDFLSFCFINRYGRKITCVIFHAIAGVCLCASAVLLYLGGLYAYLYGHDVTLMSVYSCLKMSAIFFPSNSIVRGGLIGVILNYTTFLQK